MKLRFCHLCELPIDNGRRFSKELRVSRDHVVPRSQGGLAGTNLKIAHRWCNNRRGSSPITPELRDRLRKYMLSKYSNQFQRIFYDSHYPDNDYLAKKLVEALHERRTIKRVR